MPLQLNIGLAKKVGEANYGSRGASVNVELELESGLIADPAKLKERIHQVFDMIRVSLNEELNGNGHAVPSSTDHGNTNGSGTTNGHPPGNGHAAANGQSQPSNGHAPRAATQSQVKALYAIAKKRNLDLQQLLLNRFRASRPEDISLKDASSLIDEMNRKE